MKIIECPRDAMQGLDEFIPTQQKIDYINQLLKVGFDTIDFGSFVSAKAIPQLADTIQVVEQLQWKQSKSKLLAIVANTRGAEQTVQFEAITYLGFPLSISETFQKRNTNKSIEEALNTIEEIKDLCEKHDKKLVSYISMGFGNPYGDPYEIDLVGNFVEILTTLGSDVISLADTIGISTPETISFLFNSLSKKFPDVEIGAHLHSTSAKANEKIQAAFEAGCKRFDGAILGFGGCPMADDDLVGNLATEKILEYLVTKEVNSGIDFAEFNKSVLMANEIFPKH